MKSRAAPPANPSTLPTEPVGLALPSLPVVMAEPKLVPLKISTTPQIARRLSDLKFTGNNHGVFVNSAKEANIREIRFLPDLANNVLWLEVYARRPFLNLTAARDGFRQRRQAEIERELRLATEYWRRTIQPYIAGRRLVGIEWFVAETAHRDLQEAARKAARWNESEAGKALPIPTKALVDFQCEEFRAPERLCAEGDMDAETLAKVAAPLLNKDTAERTPAEAIRIAHELIIAARRHLESLPRLPNFLEAISQSFKEVTFSEILRWNEQDSARLPLLPPAQMGRHAGKLTATALKAAVERFLDQKAMERPRLTKEDYERGQEQDQRLANEGKLLMVGTGAPKTFEEWQREPQEAKENCLQNQLIALVDLCEMRRKRFADFMDDQAARGDKQRGKPKPKKQPVKPGAKLPVSAASSPGLAGKREKGKVKPAD